MVGSFQAQVVKAGGTTQTQKKTENQERVPKCQKGCGVGGSTKRPGGGTGLKKSGTSVEIL